MKHFQISRFYGACAFVTTGTLLASIAGCGGGGSGVSVPTSTPIATGTTVATATPIPTSVSSNCTATTYTPNYYGLRDPTATDNSPNVYNFWRQFPVTVYIPPSSATTDRAVTLAGFNQWLTATDNRANYQLVSSASGADLVVSYTSQDPNDATLGLTTVYYSSTSNAIDHVTMQLLFYTTADRADAVAANQSIAAHEFGHALGVGPHSPYTADLMYPYLERAQETVTTRDLNTLKTIYCNTFPTRSINALKPLQGPIVKKVYKTLSK